MNNKNNFPNIPTLKARWWPIQIEPIINSGEIITIGVVVIAETGESIVKTALSEKALQCAFGENGKALYKTAQFCLDALSEHINNTKLLENWISPISHVNIGIEHPAVGDNLNSIYRMAMRSCASFSLPLIEQIDKELQIASMPEEPPIKEEKFTKQVIKVVNKNQPEYIINFNKRINLIEGGITTQFDYLSQKYCANLGEITKLTTRSLNISLSKAREKLWTLEILRENWTNIIKEENFELIMHRPKSLNIEYTESSLGKFNETIYEIKEEAKQRQLNIHEVDDAYGASERILEKEAA